MHRLGEADRDNSRHEGHRTGRYISVGCTLNGHVDERMEGRMISSVKFHGNREWKEAALVGPSLPLIVPPCHDSRSLSFPPLLLDRASFFSDPRPLLAPRLSRLALIRPALLGRVYFQNGTAGATI